MRTSVIIIGGGVAGLGAGRELARHGVPVTVLEAKNRLGGRILTTHRHGLPLELGAEFIHGRNKALLRAISDANLTTHSVPGQPHVLDGGTLGRMNLWNRIDRVIARINPRSPDLAFGDFLARGNFSAASRRLATGFVEGFDAAHIDRISAHAILRAEKAAQQMDGEWQGRVNEGYSALVDFLASEITVHGGALERRAVVCNIRWKKGAVEVIARHRGRFETHSTAAVILTVPIGVWKAGAIRVEPALPQKEDAVARMEFGNVVKVVLVFRNKWWPVSANGFIHAPNEPFPTWWEDPRGPVLTGWAGGPRADALLNLPFGCLEEICLRTIASIFSARTELIRRRLVGSHYHDWARDPHIRGAYSYIPVNGLALPRQLAAPVQDTLFFAGEATVSDAQTGTVFGALESGLRAANEVLKSAVRWGKCACQNPQPSPKQMARRQWARL